MKFMQKFFVLDVNVMFMQDCMCFYFRFIRVSDYIFFEEVFQIFQGNILFLGYIKKIK